ncbi:hypothetical protein D6745_02435 [Candidatus Woesearchaeota archaeon]|nr:MAG: hypothetical protein D6745_02435 [Candidatus Woesearchaeota archaeon]
MEKTTQKMFLKAEGILKYLEGNNDKIDTLIMCKPNNIELVTTDQSLYEAVGSVKDKTKINYAKLVKFLEVVNIVSFKEKMQKPRTILKEERVKELRKKVSGGE